MNYFELGHYQKKIQTHVHVHVKRTQQFISHEILVDMHKRSEIHALLHRYVHGDKANPAADQFPNICSSITTSHFLVF